MLGFLLRWSINLVALVAAESSSTGVLIQSVSAGILRQASSASSTR